MSSPGQGLKKWHTLRVTMAGPRIVCYIDGQKSLEADDATFLRRIYLDIIGVIPTSDDFLLRQFPAR